MSFGFVDLYISRPASTETCFMSHDRRVIIKLYYDIMLFVVVLFRFVTHCEPDGHESRDQLGIYSYEPLFIFTYPLVNDCQ